MPRGKKKLTLEVGSPEWHKLRNRAKSDLFWFNAKVLGHEDLFPMTYKAHYGLCRFAEKNTGIPEVDACRVQLIQIWRGAGKSLNVTKGRSIQKLIQNQNYSIGIANERQDNANAFLGMIKAEFEQNDFLRALFPECVPEDFRKTEWRSDRIVINRTRPNPVNPSVLATGIGGTVTGVHMDEWIVDDLISQDAAENARAGSYTEIEKANRWIVRLQPLLSRPKSDPITFIGTPWWIGDCYEFIEEFFGRGQDPKIFNWTLNLPGGEIQTIQIEVKGELAIFRHYPIIDGRATWPEGDLTLEKLEQLRQDDPVFFAAQYLIQPGAGEASDFNEAWLKDYAWEGLKQIRWRDQEGKTRFENVNELHTIISVDPAIGRTKHAARSAITVTGTNGTEIFLLEAWANRVGATELATKTLEFYQRYNASRIVIEVVAYQEALAEVLSLLAPQMGIRTQLPIYEHKTGGETRKEVRIRGLEPYFRKGLIYIDPTSQHDFMAEYRNFPHYKFRDLLDALSFQKELWERLSTRGVSESGVVREWQERQRTKANQIMDRFRRKARV